MVRVVVTSPELMVTNMMASSTNVVPSEPITLLATLRNTGDGSSTSTTLRWYLSTDTNITTADTEIGTSLLSDLAAGASSTERISINAPPSLGTYHYGVCVDPAMGETDPNDNCSSAVSVVVAAPELIAINMMANKTTLAPSENIILRATVRNTGDRSSASTTCAGIARPIAPSPQTTRR